MTAILVGTTKWRGASRPGTAGLYRLEAADGTWRLVPEIPTNGAQAISVDRRGFVFAATGDGVYRSDDRGEHWRRAGSGSEGRAIWSILPHPGRPGVIFAGLGPRGILRSDDDGETWREARLDEPAAIFNIADDGVTLLPFSARVTGIAADENRPELIYASVEVEGVLRSKDGGLTWHDCSKGLLEMADSEHLRPKIGTMDGRKSMADGHAILVHKGVVFYANRLGLFRSDDCGETWEDVRLDRVSPLTYVRSIVVSPTEPDTFLATLSVKSSGNDGTVWKSRDAGRSWVRIDRAIAPDSTLMAVAAHPSDPATIYATSYSGQVFGSEDGGTTWTTLRGPEGATESYAMACL